jgi:4-amino-4-deoxy-L-arabinose transferase-like glycosyltransferase
VIRSLLLRIGEKELASVVIAALILRALVTVGALATGAGLDAFHAPDTDSYLHDARQLLASGTFGAPGAPEIVRTPGYPLLLLPGVILGAPELVTILIQVLLSTLTVVVVYDIGRLLLHDRRAALIAAGLYAFEPLSVLYASLILTETLFTFLILAALDLLVRYQASGRWCHSLLAAVPLAASVYVRPVSYFLPLWLGVLLVGMALRPSPERARRLGQVVVFVLSAVVLVGGWQVRNARVAGYPRFSAIQDINLYFYQGAAVLAAEEGVPYYQVQDRMGYEDRRLYLAQHPEQTDWSDAERYRSMGRQGAALILGYPLDYARIHLQGMVRALVDPGAVDYLRLFQFYPRQGGLLGEAVDKGMVAAGARLAEERPLAFWSMVVLGVQLLVYYLLVFVGLFSGRIPWAAAMLLLAAAIYFVLISGGPASLSRFRHPVMPVVCLFAAAGAAEVLARRDSYRRKRTARA